MSLHAAGSEPKATVLNVVDMYPNKRGPLELQLLAMAARLRVLGWHLILCFNREAPEWFAAAAAQEGAELMTVARPDGAGRRELVDWVRARRPDIVHLHMISARRLAPALSRCRLRGLVVTEHMALPAGAPPRALYRAFGVRHVDRFIAVSEHVARNTRRGYLVPRRKLRVVLNGTDLDRFVPRPDRLELRASLLGLGAETIVVTAAAHLIPRKRMDLLIRAMPELLEQAPAVRLVVAGKGPELEALHDLIDALGLRSSCQILSREDNDVAAIYGASDVGALLSSAEALGGSAVEVMACGLPLVVTATPGLDEVPEDGVSGVVVHDQTPAGVARALAPLVLDADLRKRMGEAGRRRAEERFDVARAADETIEVYRELLIQPDVSRRQHRPVGPG